MAEATQPDAESVRVALDNGETVELDGGTLLVDGTPSPSVVLRLAPWRARSLAHVLDEWSATAKLFDRDRRASVYEVELSRTLNAAADALGEPGPDVVRGPRKVVSGQRLAAVAVLATKEQRLSTLQRLAVVDAAAWWLAEERGGEELAYALLDATCSAAATTEHAYLALITPPPTTVMPDGQVEGRSS